MPPLPPCRDTFFKVAETRAFMSHLRMLGDLSCQDIDLFAQTYTVLSSTHAGKVVVVYPNEQIVVVPGPIFAAAFFPSVDPNPKNRFTSQLSMAKAKWFLGNDSECL